MGGGNMKLFAAMTAVGVLAVAASVDAAGGHKHGSHHGDQQMAKLHQMMPRYGAAQASIAAALADGDLKAVVADASYILSTTKDLRQSKPHKHLERLDEYRAIASGFEQEVVKVAKTAEKGDAAGAKAAFEKAQKLCDACHAKFRD